MGILRKGYDQILSWATVRSGNKETAFASTSQLDQLRPELDIILHEIALIMKEPQDTVEDWLGWCFVSDESCLFEFIYEEDELNVLRQQLNLPKLSGRQSFVQIASQLRNRKQASS